MTELRGQQQAPRVERPPRPSAPPSLHRPLAAAVQQVEARAITDQARQCGCVDADRTYAEMERDLRAEIAAAEARARAEAYAHAVSIVESAEFNSTNPTCAAAIKRVLSTLAVAIRIGEDITGPDGVAEGRDWAEARVRARVAEEIARAIEDSNATYAWEVVDIARQHATVPEEDTQP